MSDELRNKTRLNSDPEERRSQRPSKREVAVDLLTSPWPWLIALPILAALGALAWYFQPEVPDVEIPRPVKVFLVGAIGGAIIGVFPGDRIVRWLYDPPRRYIVQPGFTADEGGIWEMTPRSFEEIEVLDGGQLYEWPGTKYPTYEVEWYDAEEHVAKGTWRGSASDGQMIDRQEDIDEMREELEVKARERDVLVTRAERIVREEILANTRQLIQEYNRATIVDVSRLQDRLDEAMSDHNLEGQLERFRRSQTSPEESPADPDHEHEQPVATRANSQGGSDGD